jgi:hypothetical protein
VKRKVNKRENMKKRNSITEVGKFPLLKLQADPKKTKEKGPQNKTNKKTLREIKTKTGRN